MKYLIGIDIGTSGTKTALFSQDGKLVAAHTVASIRKISQVSVFTVRCTVW